MSRIGRMPITIPSGVDVTIDGSNITVKGPKGQLSHVVVEPISVSREEDGQLSVVRPNDERESRARHGLTRTLVANMITGVTEGYSKTWKFPELVTALQLRETLLNLHLVSHTQ